MNIKTLLETNKTAKDISEQKELVWINENKIDYAEYEKNLVVSDEAIKDAEDRLVRFSNFIRKVFPETENNKGIIESPLEPVFKMQDRLEEQYSVDIPGDLFLKMDSHLPIAGSIKARGGVYEVLKYAETLAIDNGLLTIEDDYSIIADEKFRDFYSKYKIQVGSTGNLGLSIGIISATLGFEVIVHMSADAKKWKKDMLRSKGVTVIEYKDDYGKAVEEGRKSSDSDPTSYFIDDENSIDLFLGYAVAASRLKKQLDEKGIIISEKNPLILHLPCGVGGAPGGVAYGAKRIFKDNVHCFFIEPTLSPCMVLGMASGLHENISVYNVGIKGMTHADGLAVATPSGFIGKTMEPMLSGIFTLKDAKLYDYLRLLKSSEDKFIEPSSCSAFEGAIKLLEYDLSREYVKKHIGSNIENACQIAWATGGVMVPEDEVNKFFNTYL